MLLFQGVFDIFWKNLFVREKEQALITKKSPLPSNQEAARE
jgi:hypothetical protein